MEITSFSKGEEIAPIALAIHKLVNNLPTTMRTQHSNGVRIEEGEIIVYNYTGPILEKVLNEGKIVHTVPERGPYTGIPVIVVPIEEKNEVIGAVGIVDITKGIFSDIKHITRRPEQINHKGEFYWK